MCESSDVQCLRLFKGSVGAVGLRDVMLVKYADVVDVHEGFVVLLKKLNDVCEVACELVVEFCVVVFQALIWWIIWWTIWCKI